LNAEEHGKLRNFIFLFTTIMQFILPTLLVFMSTSSSSIAMTFWPIEAILSTDPIIAQACMFMKMMFRARFAAPFKSTSIGVFEPHVCLFEIIGMGVGTVYFFVRAMMNNGCGRSVSDDGMMKKLNNTDFADVENKQKKDADVKAEYNRT
jgi:hypothetical protein